MNYDYIGPEPVPDTDATSPWEAFWWLKRIEEPEEELPPIDEEGGMVPTPETFTGGPYVPSGYAWYSDKWNITTGEADMGCAMRTRLAGYPKNLPEHLDKFYQRIVDDKSTIIIKPRLHTEDVAGNILKMDDLSVPVASESGSTYLTPKHIIDPTSGKCKRCDKFPSEIAEDPGAECLVKFDYDSIIRDLVGGR